MKPIFMQTAECGIKGKFDLCVLPDVIREHTTWDFLYQKTDTGCILKPTFRNMPYRNSFTPEIDIHVSCDDTKTVLHMQARPVKAVRIFMAICFAFLLAIQIMLLAGALIRGVDSLFPVFIPTLICAFGYFICNMGMRIAFKTVIVVIAKR